MRTTVDLICELNTEAARYGTVMLVVGFEKHSEFVWSGEDKQLEKLNRLVEKGGEPVGLIAAIKNEYGQVTRMMGRPLTEYQDERWVADYLKQLIETSLGLGGAESIDVNNEWMD